MANVNTTMMSLTPAQIAALPPQEQAQYMKGLSPAQQALVQQEIMQQVISANRKFMRQSFERTAYMPVTGGSGTTATYSAGTTLYFDFPSVAGFAKAILITYNLTVTPATGTGATYAVNPAAPFNIFSELQVLYNGPQVRTHPYFLKVLDQLGGVDTLPQNAAHGTADATINANVNGGTPITVNSANTWKGKILLRLNALGDDTVPGVLPTAGVGNKPQLKLTCCPAFIGLDPLMNPIAPVAGTGHSSTTVTGSINCDMVFLDGTNGDNPTPLTLNWQHEPTLQYYWDSPLTPFNSGTIQRQTISTKLKHWYVVSLIIDANQANQFTALSNLTGFELGPDQVGQQTFVNWNISNNVSIYDFYDRMVRRVWQVDLDNGVIPWIAGPSRGIINSSNRNGIQYLNMYPGGFPAATHSYQVGSVSGQSTIDGYTAPTPRVETFLISENSAGLKVS
jgi:hypothetical protein